MLLDWQSKDKAEAAKNFVGQDCRLCRDPGWTVEKKNMN
jgi:hypothetical protein